MIAKEKLRPIGTVRNPAIFDSGRDVWLAYETHGSSAILGFSDVIQFTRTPDNVDQIAKYSFKVEYYQFNEYPDAPLVQKWQALNPRFWIISFHDETVEILFEKVGEVGFVEGEPSPAHALVQFLADRG